MSTEREVVVLSAVRTAIGKYGGSLKDHPPTELAATVVRESVKRAGVDPREVGHVVFGNVIHTDAHDMYLSRVATIKGGLPIETPALTLNRMCGTGLQAIVSAAQIVKLGDADVAVAGGSENMSRGQYWLPALRWGQRMNDTAVIDATVGALTDPFDDCHMGITAENVAHDYEIGRAQQDRFAAGTLVWWTYGLSVNAHAFIQDHLRKHLVHRARADHRAHGDRHPDARPQWRQAAAG